MRSVPSMKLKFAAIAVMAAAGFAGANGAAAADADKGKIAYTKNGCWQCHGYEGQGSIVTSNGRVLARTQLPLDAFKAFVRTTNGAMPPFRPAVLSDEDLGVIAEARNTAAEVGG